MKRLADLGFEILATAGTASMLRRHGVVVTTVRKFSQGVGPDGRRPSCKPSWTARST